MKALANLAVVVATVCLVVGIASRLMLKPIPLGPGGLEARALIAFANTCLLYAIVLILLQKKQ